MYFLIIFFNYHSGYFCTTHILSVCMFHNHLVLVVNEYCLYGVCLVVTCLGLVLRIIVLLQYLRIYVGVNTTCHLPLLSQDFGPIIAVTASFFRVHCSELFYNDSDASLTQ